METHHSQFGSNIICLMVHTIYTTQLRVYDCTDTSYNIAYSHMKPIMSSAGAAMQQDNTGRQIFVFCQ
jgi:hypothetical protein